MGGTIVDTTPGYEVEILDGVKSAKARLKAPVFGAAALVVNDGTHTADEGDSTGMLVAVGESEITARPEAKGSEEVGALPVVTEPGLYYQAAWGDDLNNLTGGDKVQATGDTLYLGVIKQNGDKGFYRLSVSER